MVNDLKLAPAHLFCVVDGGDASFLRLNRVLRSRHYQLEVMSLSTFEKHYRDAFYLQPYRGEAQTEVVLWRDACAATKEQYITPDFFSMLSESEAGVRILKSGFVLLLRKNISMTLAGGAVASHRVQPELDQFKRFTDQLSVWLRLTRYSRIAFSNHFAYLLGEQALIRCDAFLAPESAVVRAYLPKDNYLLELLLNAEGKMAEYLRLIIWMFCEAIQVRRPRVKFLQLLLTLEACFAVPAYPCTPKDIARYTAALLATGKVQLEAREQEVLRWYELRTHLLMMSTAAEYEDSIKGPLEEELPGMTEVVREAIRKMIRFNFKDRRLLLDKLCVKR